MNNSFTVAQYLKTRLEQMGLNRLFGVAGNYTAPFLNTILADVSSPIKISGNANEMCAGYAADAYARLKGFSALHVTYSVGAFSLLNTIAGSFTEQVAVLLINGAPTNNEDSIEKNAGLLYSHTTGYQQVDINVFRQVTVAAERVTNARQATFQIDSVLTAILTYQKPGYLEITEDVWRQTCNLPEGILCSGADDFIKVSQTPMAVKATMNILSSSSKAIFWAGIELQRFGLEDQFLSLLNSVNSLHSAPGDSINFVTTPLSKSVISENNQYFEGCVTLSQNEIKALVGADGCIIGIGAWTTGKDTSNQNIRSSNTIFAAQNGVWAGAQFFPLVKLSDFIQQLKEAFDEKGLHESMQIQGLRWQNAPQMSLFESQVTKAINIPLTYDLFFNAINEWISEDDILVVDAGFPLVGAQSVKIGLKDGFVAQAAWLAIGYSVAAATGVKFARPDKRVIVTVGDGAFHETCQAVADHHAFGQNTVVFVLANGIYGIEQEIVNPNVFRTPPVDYSDQLLDSVYAYNILPAWKYDKITNAFGGEGRKAGNIAEMAIILKEIRETPDCNFVVEITLPKTDIPGAIRASVNNTKLAGEDEIENPFWPSPEVY